MYFGRIYLMSRDSRSLEIGDKAMSKRLTPKQEKFCYLYIQYGDAAKAYREAYNSAQMKPATIRRKAVELMNIAR